MLSLSRSQVPSAEPRMSRDTLRKKGLSHLYSGQEIGSKLSSYVGAMALIALALTPGYATAQEYPAQPIHLVVPGTPGITGDILARLLGTKLSERLKVSIVVDNKVGAGGILGTQFVAKSAPNGYTLLVANTSYSTLTALNKLPPEIVNNLVPVSLLGTSTMTLIATNSFPAKNVRELIEEIKKRPGFYNYASPGVGSVQSMAMELFAQEAGISLTHVPYKGTAGSLNDLIAGHVELGVVSVPVAATMIKAGKIRILAMLGKKRAAQFPDVPTMVESGFPNVVVETWSGIMAPVGVSPAVIAKLNKEIDDVLKLPDFREASLKAGVEPVGGAPGVLGSLMHKEVDMWRLVIKRGNIVAD